MLNARQSQQDELERHVQSRGFKTYMAVWSIFFTAIIGITLYGNARTYLQSSDTPVQRAELTAKR
jgi:hypothetical protein